MAWVCVYKPFVYNFFNFIFEVIMIARPDFKVGDRVKVKNSNYDPNVVVVWDTLR